MKKAIITGITGQGGAYLSELLLNKGYQVYDTYRRTSSTNFWRIDELGISTNPNLHLVEYDLTDQSSNLRLIAQVEPDEIYNLAAQSFVGVSFDQPLSTATDMIETCPNAGNFINKSSKAENKWTKHTLESC